MIEIKKEELLKDSIDYEEYSENICELSFEELLENGLISCGGCCSKKKTNDSTGKCCENGGKCCKNNSDNKSCCSKKSKTK